MALELPTDTQHLTLDTRQYELFGRPLGHGIPRSRIYFSVIVCLLWWVVLLIFGPSPLTRLGPTLYLVPPFATVFLGTRLGDDGRMHMMHWYDTVLAILPHRRRLIHNPLMSAAAYIATPIRLHHAVELWPRSGPERPKDTT